MEPKEIVTEMIKELVLKPEAVKCIVIESGNSCIFEISCDPSDVGMVLGRKGITIDAIRRIVMAMGGRNDKRYLLEFLTGDNRPSRQDDHSPRQDDRPPRREIPPNDARNRAANGFRDRPSYEDRPRRDGGYNGGGYNGR